MSISEICPINDLLLGISGNHWTSILRVMDIDFCMATTAQPDG
jgi:hypothetical protein